MARSPIEVLDAAPKPGSATTKRTLGSKAIKPCVASDGQYTDGDRKGTQVTPRRELLGHLGVRAGDKIVVDLLPSGRAELRAASSDLSAFLAAWPLGAKRFRSRR